MIISIFCFVFFSPTPLRICFHFERG
jgi:hypothetical protein